MKMIQSELHEFGISDNSVLTLAISHTAVVPEHKYTGIHREIFERAPEYECVADPVSSVNALFDMFQDEMDSDDEQQYEQHYEIPESKEEEHEPQFLEPYLGFDVIMQEGGVMVYRMPTCGHEMNKESLYDYCHNTFKDNANTKLFCPHRTKNGKCNVEWDLNAVLDVLRHEQLHETDEKLSKYHENDSIELHEFGISDNSVLTLAISHTAVIPEHKYTGIHREIFERAPEYECVADPVSSVNALFDMFQDEMDSDDEQQYEQHYEIPESKEEEHEPQFLEPYLGFDVIMQEGGVMVYRMPTCGHEMNKESLYDYCHNTLKDNANTKLFCPHRTKNGKCNVEWDLNAVLDVLRHEQLHETDEKLSTKATHWKDTAKLELLASRNIIENGGHNVQKCPRCQTLYFKEKQESNLKLDQIKSMYHIQQEFKTKCIYCQPSMPQYLNQEKLRIKKSEMEIAKEEGSKMNSLFGMFEEEEKEELNDQQLQIEAEEDEKRELENAEAINSMFNMFTDPEDEPMKKKNVTHLNQNMMKMDIVYYHQQIISVSVVEKNGLKDIFVIINLEKI
eukprot:CAMPEP_0201592522 /NCGR_PEP_ID=MMETSP0190_2-20130828/190395_1 /ASSEMBLY_ACC=CAM_ASM_000263 /TAXON_ID=37353 /ORGANISM="Rosalina sp." /LENGTH=563 /DNA_ID=CAMNT_0048051333 /DNA_START=398 /DNA_END=2089 /DNA_ORIENTATION=-